MSFLDFTLTSTVKKSIISGNLQTLMGACLRVERPIFSEPATKPIRRAEELLELRGRAERILAAELPRFEFARCTEISHFLRITPENIPAIKLHLDFVEASVFLATIGSNPNPDLEHAIHVAFNARNCWYNNNVVNSSAKHSGPELHQHLLKFLRSSYAQLNEQQKVRVQRRHQELLLQNGIQEIWRGGEARLSFRDGHRIKDHSRILSLANAHYKALEGLTVLENFVHRQASQRPLVFRATVGGVTSTRAPPDIDEFIRGIPHIAIAMVTAREVEACAFDSCLGFEQDAATKDPHVYEQGLALRISEMNFNVLPQEFIRQILDAKRRDALKKYLKYKNKYLNLKKQLNL